MTSSLVNALLKRQKLGNFRTLTTHQHLIDFCSNDYLGLARSSVLLDLVTEEWNGQIHHLNKLGSTGSRLLTGNSAYVERLEDKIAQFHGYEAGLLFGCGYMANIGLISGIARSQDFIIFDAKIHASTRDGIRLSPAMAFPFKHNDLQHLESRLRNYKGGGECFICVESIYSTDGSAAPLNAISQLAKEYKARLIVDEAHGVGVCGPQGRGLVAQCHLTKDVFAQITTFGKAVGTYGAIVLGNQALKQTLINFATPYIYTTAPPLHSLIAISCSYDLFPKLEKERQHLQKLVQQFRGSYPTSSTTPIQSLSMKGNQLAKHFSHYLASQGFDIRPLLSPTVQRGHELIRICLHAFNTEEQLATLLTAIKDFSYA